LENRAIVPLGHLIGFLINPYTINTISLYDQLESLSATAHTLWVLYHQNKTLFIPGQQFINISFFIKNCFWCTAKQKLHDPDASFYLIQTGSDRLENQFGIYWSMGYANIDILQLTQHAVSAAKISHIITQNPDWDRGHRCLKLTSAEGIDHTNPCPRRAIPVSVMSR
ncbi:hypothetical protein JAAARDRAFT_143486, partial [Jaapia argillacea MUCL 33604]